MALTPLSRAPLNVRLPGVSAVEVFQLLPGDGHRRAELSDALPRPVCVAIQNHDSEPAGIPNFENPFHRFSVVTKFDRFDPKTRVEYVYGGHW